MATQPGAGSVTAVQASSGQSEVRSSPLACFAPDAPTGGAGEAPRPLFDEWLRARLPPGGRVDVAADGGVEVVHTVAAGDTTSTIAKAYLGLTDVYGERDLGAAIAKENRDLHAGSEVRIPHLLAEPFRSPDDDRMTGPADRALKGIYLTGGTAGQMWPAMLERAASHGLNAIVVDAKASGGDVTYSTRVKLARDSGAGRSPSIPDFSRAVRFAHERGITVIARVTCFRDPWLASYAPRLAVQSKSGGTAAIGWLDPASAQVQDYLVDLVEEVVDLGADEVQLDYVRFPVEGTADAAMLPPDGHRARAIAAFVERVHELTASRHVPLSLDVFGIAASGPRGDIDALGQNLVLLGPEAEAISPMVYPSHYPVGTLGFEHPGDHPELVGFGTKAAVQKLASAQVTGTIIRPWLQAAPFRTSTFGPGYILDEIRNAEASGAAGWLLWDAGNSYWAVWKALPVVGVHPAKEVVVER